MRSAAALVLLIFAAGAVDAFVGTSRPFGIAKQRRADDQTTTRSPSMQMVSQTASDSRYISFSADTGFLVSPSAFNAVLDRFELRKRLNILLRDLDSKCDALYGGEA